VRPSTVRALRAGLLALVISVTAAVAWLLRPSPPAPPSPSAPAAAEPAAPRTERLVYRNFKGDKVSFTLQAESQVGREQEELHLRGVVLTFSYVARGAEDTTTITADDCVYTPSVQRAVFRGHVHVRTTANGFELTSEELVYRGDKGLARSDDVVHFKRKDVSGTSKGMTYHAEEGRLELAAEVFLVIADEKRPEMRIRAGRADAEREEGALRFADGVEVTQGPDTLKAARLNVNFTPEQTIYRAVAVDDVDLQASSAGLLPSTSGALASGGGRHLRCKKLDLWFRPDRSVKEATAGPDADLVAMSGPREPPERRHLKARVLVFHFDEQGRLEEVQAQKDSSFVAEALPPAAAPPRTVDCQSFVARLDPPTGEAREIEFNKDVVFRQGQRVATAQAGWYQGKDALLLLKEGPRLVDEEHATELSARAIDLGTRTGDVSARHDVRHVMSHRRGPGKAGLLGNDAPVIMTARFFDYEAKTRTARYREDALLRSGRDEIRAPEIRHQEDEAGKRRLHAAGGVVSLLHPRPAPGEKLAGAVEGRAAEMLYDEVKGQIVYKGDVTLRQGDIATRSPQATLVLTADGTGVEKLTAGEPVEFRQGTRVATGSRGTYTPASGSVELMGEHVELKDATQQVRGRALTFNLRDDRVTVDGREQMRTETVLRKTPPKP
jgi:lipopolysaccharide transport protein LptA/LPS export ABC transporter protein LptC